MPGASNTVSLRRLIVIALSVVGAVLLAIVLYLAFADLGRTQGPHRGPRHEADRPAFRDRRGARAQSAPVGLCPRRACPRRQRGMGLEAADGRDRAPLDAHRAVVADLGTRGRPLVRAERRLGSPREEPRRQGQLGVRQCIQKRRLRPTRASRSSRRSSSTPSSATCRSPIASPGSRTASRSLRR